MTGLSTGDGIAIVGVSAPVMAIVWSIVQHFLTKDQKDEEDKLDEVEAKLDEAKDEALRTALLSEITKLTAELQHLKEKTEHNDVAVKQRVTDLENRVEKILDILIDLLKDN